MNLEERLRGALKSLEDLLNQPHDLYRRPDEDRLRGKIEGVKLALSYLNDESLGKDWPHDRPPKHEHDWRTFRGLGLCICVAEPHCFTNRHPYGMFDDCGDHNERV